MKMAGLFQAGRISPFQGLHRTPNLLPSAVSCLQVLDCNESCEIGVNNLANKTKLVSRSGKKKLSEEEEEWEALSHHKEEAERSLMVLSQLMPEVAAEDAVARDLRDHANGFYEEIDKLAKGKSLLEVTDRALEETNSIISDAKRIVGDDPYLQRTHEFVAAGNNPVYPDVVLALRAVIQSLDRYRAKKKEEAEVHAGILYELNTILAAMQLLAEGDESSSKDILQRRMGQAPSPKWMVSLGYNDSNFNFERFKSLGPPIVKDEKRKRLALGSGE